MKHAETLRLLYCRQCAIKTQHYRDLKHSWGYSCYLCQTWQHENAVFLQYTDQDEGVKFPNGGGDSPPPLWS